MTVQTGRSDVAPAKPLPRLVVGGTHSVGSVQ